MTFDAKLPKRLRRDEGVHGPGIDEAIDVFGTMSVGWISDANLDVGQSYQRVLRIIASSGLEGTGASKAMGRD
jgi:hypothetical protein